MSMLIQNILEVVAIFKSKSYTLLNQSLHEIFFVFNVLLRLLGERVFDAIASTLAIQVKNITIFFFFLKKESNNDVLTE